MRRTTGTAILLGAALLGSVWLARRSDLGQGLMRVADTVSHTAFALSERLFHPRDVERRVVHSVRVRGEAAGSVARAQEGPFTWSGRLDAGDRVDVRGLNGSITAVASSGSTVEVRATKRSRRGDVDDVRVEVEERSDGIRVCAIYEDGWNGCADGQGRNRRSHRQNDVQVHFEIEVPAGVGLTASSINGGIDIDGGIADVTARAVNGSVAVEGSGQLDVESVNGSVDARLIGAEITGPVRVSSVNGSVELDLPDGADADVRASWVNGGFASDIPVTLESRSKRSARGTLGAGGESVVVETVNGRIRIR